MKQARSTKVINAFIIRFAIGILIYGVAKNNLGLFALIPLFIIHKMVNGSKGKKQTAN